MKIIIMPCRSVYPGMYPLTLYLERTGQQYVANLVCGCKRTTVQFVTWVCYTYYWYHKLWVAKI